MESREAHAQDVADRAIDNLLIDRTVTLDCHLRKGNLSMAWIDVKKAYDSVDHGWL